MKMKLGFAVGVNVAVACLLMQGCKAPRVTDNNYGSDVKTVEARPVAPADDIKVAPAPTVAPVPAEPVPVTVAPVAVVPATPAVVPPADDFTLYTVKPGDMLSKIARRFGIRQKAILDLNPGLAPNRLYAGKKIKLPGKVVEKAPAVAAEPAPVAGAASVKAPKTVKAAKYTGATQEYVVKSGDSLGLIAHRNGTNVRTLKEINGISSDRLFIGQKLKVPAGKKAAAPAAGKKAAAKPAKDVKKAAPAKAAAPAAKEAPAAKVEAAVPVEAKKDEVKPAADAAAPVAAPEAAAPAPVPAAAPEAAAPAAPAAAPAPAAPAPVEMHTVKEGEDVVSIAISYGLSPSALIEANDLKSNEVKPGDTLKIPVKSAQ